MAEKVPVDTLPCKDMDDDSDNGGTELDNNSDLEIDELESDSPDAAEASSPSYPTPNAPPMAAITRASLGIPIGPHFENLGDGKLPKKTLISVSKRVLNSVKEQISPSRKGTCSNCGETIAKGLSIGDHRKRHCTMELPEKIVCPICNKPFSRDSSLKRHLKESRTTCQRNLMKVKRGHVFTDVKPRNALTKAVALAREKLRTKSSLKDLNTS